MDNTPIQYQKGWVEFYKLKFKVTKNVLIPRPETELLVDRVLAFHALNKPIVILDIGTGAGNIAISVAKNIRDENVKIIATDVSAKALIVAKQNAKFHGVNNKITFLESNLLDNLPKDLNPDIIVTNLPYIPSQRIPFLDSSVKDFEPLVALDGGEDGFDLYRKLFSQIKKLGLTPRLIIGEIDYTHGQLAVDEGLNFFPESEVIVKTDLSYRQRILTITDQEVLLG